MRAQKGMKPQDCLVLLKIITMGSGSWMAKDLAREVGLSPTEVSMSLDRSRYANLIDDAKKRVNTGVFLDFLVHGLKVVFPVQRGGIVRGMPTAWSAPPLSELVASSEAVVWPHEEGSVRGEGVEPLYPSVPMAAMGSKPLHKLLALVDALRVGRVRERELAAKILKQRFDAYALLGQR
jgi:hypothetical protein